MELADLQGLEERFLMRTYKRAPVEFVRGEGAVLWDAEGREYLDGILQSSVRMAALIDALLTLSRVTRTEVKRDWTLLSDLAEASAKELARAHPSRAVKFIADSGIRRELRPIRAPVYVSPCLKSWRVGSFAIRACAGSLPRPRSSIWPTRR